MSSFSGKEIALLEQELILIQKDVGVKQLLGDIEVERLIEKLLNEFEDFTIQEITHAVNEAVMGRLMFDGKPVDPNHYGEFGFMYLARILKAYQFYRGTIIRKYYDGEEQLRIEDQKANAAPLTEDQKRDSARKLALSNFESFCEGRPTVALHLVYETLNQAGLMKFPEEKMKVFRETALQNTKREAVRGNTSAKSIMEVLKRDNGTDPLDWQVKALAVKAFFSELKDMEVQLCDIFQ